MEKRKGGVFDKVFYSSAHWSLKLGFFIFLILFFMRFMDFAVTKDASSSLLFFIIAYFVLILVYSINLVVGYKIIVGLSDAYLYTLSTGNIDWRYVESAHIASTRKMGLAKQKCIFLKLKKGLSLSKKIRLHFYCFSTRCVPAICERNLICGASLEDVLEAIKLHLEKNNA